MLTCAGCGEPEDDAGAANCDRAIATYQACLADGDSDAECRSQADAVAGSCELPACIPRENPVSLIVQREWVYQTSADEDPLAEHRPDEIVCPEFSYELEGSILEVDTGACNYLSVAQPSQAAVKACDTMQVTVSHFNLYAPEPATGHVSVLIDGDPVLDEVRQIPHPSDFIHVRWEAKRDYPAGVPIVFHVHNHGVNEWQIVDISVGAQ